MVGLQSQQENYSENSYAAVMKSSKIIAQQPENSVPEILTDRPVHAPGRAASSTGGNFYRGNKPTAARYAVASTQATRNQYGIAPAPTGSFSNAQSNTHNVSSQRINVQCSRTQDSKFSGVRRFINILIGGCNKETTIEDLKDYCKDLEVTLLDCVELQIRSIWSKAFKISVHGEDETKLRSGESWPANVYVRQFFCLCRN